MKRCYFDLPLDRDYGANGYEAYSWMKGKKLIYRDIIESKTPGLKIIYMLIIKFMGINRKSFRKFYAHYTSLTIIAVYFLGTILYSREAGLLGAALFALYSCAPYFWWHFSNAEVYYTLPAVICFIFESLAFKTSGISHGVLIAFAGFMAGCTFMIKQTSILNTVAAAVCAIVYLQLQKPAQCILDLLLFGISFGVWFGFFFFYFMIIAKTPFSKLPFTWKDVKGHIKYASVPLFRKNPFVFHFHRSRLRAMHLAGLFSVALSFCGILYGATHNQPWAWILGPWFLLGILSVIVSSTYLPYHFIPLVAPAAIMSGIVIALGIADLRATGPGGISFASTLIISFFIIGIFAFTYHLFQDQLMPREMYDGEHKMWDNCEQAGKFIKENSNDEDCVYTWGSEQTIYLWSERQAATSALFSPSMNPALFTPDAVARELAELLRSRPKFFVLTAPFDQFTQFEAFVKYNYKLAKDFGKAVYVFQRTDTILPATGKA
jgi:hypothetical protein